MIFILTYNLVRRVENPRFVVNTLIVMNVLVAIYCIIQLQAGPGAKVALFGIDAFEFERNRGTHDPRLTGPFSGPGVTAELLGLLTLVLAYDALRSTGARKYWVFLLIAVDLGLMVATANRGSFLTLMVVFPLFLSIPGSSRNARALKIAIVSAVVVVAASVIVISFTDFGRLFTPRGNHRDGGRFAQDAGRYLAGGLGVIPAASVAGHRPALEAAR